MSPDVCLHSSRTGQHLYAHLYTRICTRTCIHALVQQGLHFSRKDASSNWIAATVQRMGHHAEGVTMPRVYHAEWVTMQRGSPCRVGVTMQRGLQFQYLLVDRATCLILRCWKLFTGGFIQSSRGAGRAELFRKIWVGSRLAWQLS